MKKLMIAAAVAAMIGGAYADGYDFTASVKTTKGKQGSAKTTYRVGVGQDDFGAYWWKDLINTWPTNYADWPTNCPWKTEKEAKAYVKKLSNDGKAAFADDILGFTPGVFANYPASANKSVDGTVADYYNQELYRNKWQWCFTFKYTVTDSDCYRVPGSAKLRGVVWMDACCDSWEFVAYDFGTTILADDTGVELSKIYHPLLYRIGSVSLAKATKVEVTGTFGEGGMGYDGQTIGTFAYAGQGAFDAKAGRISSISGNIVGVLENPDCEACCDDNQTAVVFECDLIDQYDAITGYQPVPNGTAAFGTFSLKYNRKY